MVLEIVVTPDCFGCEEASRLAALLRREFPALGGGLHILGPGGSGPPGGGATPPYLLDGQPPFLGNPRPAALGAAGGRRAQSRARTDGGEGPGGCEGAAAARRPAVRVPAVRGPITRFRSTWSLSRKNVVGGPNRP